MQLQRNSVLTGLILAASVSRLVPHAPNFTAVGAIALFGGATFASRRRAVLVPITALVLTDLLLGVFVYGIERGFRFALPVYASMALTVLLGRVCGRSWTGVGTGAVLATLVFFFVVNLAVWVQEVFYPPDLAGLLACYVAGIPFAANMLLANVVFGAALFGMLRFIEVRRPEIALDFLPAGRCPGRR